ncbi:hypothetical protein PHMEG_00022289 [Phytophthora megakarya]|uniref:RxLR effector protein n=1 Tax=Phytophthora megakarya TaxID=4795 RepID=A0A225VJ43_9STRA|nr:hypothetical protein PHMEG_00022289 [Phytophthora megakarya]
MRLTFALTFSTLVLISVISASEVQNESTTPIPPSKLRADTNVPPPPHTGERRLGIFDWLYKSPTAAPETPPPATPSFGDNGNNDNGPFTGMFWDVNGRV